jgi:hypothetical protein
MNALGTASLPSTVWEQQSVRRTCCFSVVNFPSTRSYPRRLERKGLPLRAHAYSSISFRYIICLDTMTLPLTGWMGRYSHCLIQLLILQHFFVLSVTSLTFRKDCYCYSTSTYGWMVQASRVYYRSEVFIIVFTKFRQWILP